MKEGAPKVEGSEAMATEFVGRPIGIYDSRNGKSLHTMKAVDITKKCSKFAIRALLQYTVSSEGTIVAMTDCIEFENPTLGKRVHYFVGKIPTSRESVFAQFAENWGIPVAELKEIVERNAAGLK